MARQRARPSAPRPRRPIARAAAVRVPFPPERLWPLVTSTDRMDRVVGLPAARFTHSPLPQGGEEHRGAYTLLGRAVVRWVEHPFEWERPRHYAVLREYQSGPLVRYYGGAELLPVAGGTRVRVFSVFTPRHRLLAPLIRFALAPLALRRACRQYRAFAAFLAGRAAEPFPTLARARSRAELPRLDALVARLGDEGAPAEPLARLRRWLAEAADEDVAGMRPLELAARWGTDPRATAGTFLRATVAGLLELRWELLCPGCRGVKVAAPHLAELRMSGRCPACNLHFVAAVDEAVEARFYPAPAVRAVTLGTYCVGGPMATPHRLAQAVVPPGAARTWQLDLPPGAYLLRSPQGPDVLALETAAGAPDRLEARLDAGGVAPARATVAAGPVTLRLTNAGAARATATLDDARWSAAGATPGRLMTLPDFRDLFSAEALAPGAELAIGRVGLLFSDLADSTALYERAGDARAFRLVVEHFAILQAAIEAAGGALVKTIGDAVMAAFPDGRAALAAGLALQRAIRALDTTDFADPRAILKVGVHAGACFAVTLNDRLDYFGTAVNLAARAQQVARGGEVVATAAVYAEAAEVVAAAGLRAEPSELPLKGLDAPVRLYRIACRALGPPDPP
ncbi:MAG TPA: adenylate/guanylate cyclase domain-containing protein [Thermomicrobiales bacterium]|nr:adenylate/guanylate cyclase domain-containing protein [Thermomicrobiales bacterium]